MYSDIYIYIYIKGKKVQTKEWKKKEKKKKKVSTLAPAWYCSYCLKKKKKDKVVNQNGTIYEQWKMLYE